MVRSLRFETKSGGGELTKGDCPIRRHLKVIMVVNGDEEEEDSHVYPITCVELLSGGSFSVALREGNVVTHFWVPTKYI
jgi:hypothetical protein